MKFEINHEKELEAVAVELIKSAQKRRVILLIGDLASGKTTLVRYFVRALGIDESISSPTFSIMNEYGNGQKVYHYDIYQDGSDKFINSNLWQNLLNEGYHLIEWADERTQTLLTNLGIEFVVVKLTKLAEQRVVEII